MGTNYIIEAQRLQKLAGIITESKLNELSSNPFKLTPEETRIADEILEIIQEGIFDKNKFLTYLKKGAITAGIIATILGSTQLDFSQKKDIIDTVKTEKVLDQEAENVADGAFAISYYKNNTDKINKMAEGDIKMSSLVRQIDDMVKSNDVNNRKSLELLGKMYKSEIDKMIKSN
jgi:hypothetical protein